MADPFDTSLPGFRKAKKGWHIRSAAAGAQKKRLLKLSAENVGLKAQLAAFHERLSALESTPTAEAPVTKTGKGRAKK